MQRHRIFSSGLEIGEESPLTLISGPCVIEGEELALSTAQRLKEIVQQYPDIQLIYKSSYDKANRSSNKSFRGPGLKEGLRILKKVKEEVGLPILTDVHLPEDVEAVAACVDIVQIPAFLCRQTDLIVAVARSGKLVNVKKGQFMSPWEINNVVQKIEAENNNQILLTERGTTFGYNNLVCDMRSIEIMRKTGYPVCFDASHAVQLPGGLGHCSGGDRSFIPTLAKSAIAAGATALFLESHPFPEKAKSDAATVFPLEDLPQLLEQLIPIFQATRLSYKSKSF